jgi:hypothetical protein
MNGAVPVRPSWTGQGKLNFLPLPVTLVMALLISPIPREQKLAPLTPHPPSAIGPQYLTNTLAVMNSAGEASRPV